ncbi:uncharacterized protein LOC135087760 isoform X2 [Ostrinia nubilalis]|nr:uncharacterized protein LOC114354571 isoform X2 [Ostrinia furnacalis]
MRGSRRVVTFCILTTIMPTILIVLPLYLRNIKYADVLYKISDSDVIQIHKGQSSIFCAKHSLKMNTSFNAFQMRGRPELSDRKKHIRLRKSMTLPDDTLEYWGFYLFKGATVELKACSRHEGSKILVVKGEKILDTCGILEGNGYKKSPSFIENKHVLVTLENPHVKQENVSDKIIKPVKENDGFNNSSNEPNIRIENNIIDNGMLDEAPKLNIDIMDKFQDLEVNITSEDRKRKRRDVKRSTLHNPNTVLDAGVNHGGNAFNNTVNTPQESAISSFENSLHECYHDNMLMNNYFPYSIQCNSTKYLEKTTTLKVTHQVLEDGYYYYIFYSDNDIVMNDIHAIFDIYKPTFQYINMSDSKICVNRTECEFDVGLFSDELVIVEVPTKDGLKNDDESSILVSICHPRMTVYIFFPISVLLLILLFAFL